MRELATIRTVISLKPIEGADLIEVARVDGWSCIVKKGEFQEGDKGIYFEIDSFLNGEDERFKFLEKNFIIYDNKIGTRLRTIRLRGQLSQGLMLPLNKFTEAQGLEVGTDLTEILKVKKWEPPIDAQLAGEVIGIFPHFIIKTDQPRIQNIASQIEENQGNTFECSIKLDGASMTVYRFDRAKNKEGVTFTDYGVCSRNYNLRETANNSLWKVARKNKMLDALNTIGRNIAFQGELIGEGISGNNENIKGQDFYLYDIYDIDNQQYLSVEDRTKIINFMNQNGFPIKTVPILGNVALNHTIDQLLEMADGESLHGKNREGLVLKRFDGQFSFKVISNWYLEKHKNR